LNIGIVGSVGATLEGFNSHCEQTILIAIEESGVTEEQVVVHVVGNDTVSFQVCEFLEGKPYAFKTYSMWLRSRALSLILKNIEFVLIFSSGEKDINDFYSECKTLGIKRKVVDIKIPKVL
jgi:hypothetical protein